MCQKSATYMLEFVEGYHVTASGQRSAHRTLRPQQPFRGSKHVRGALAWMSASFIQWMGCTLD